MTISATGTTVLHDPMQEMYEFFAFGDALDDGLSVDVLVEQHAAEGHAHLLNRVQELTARLQELINVNEQDRNELILEARELAPRAAQEYCYRLSRRVDELKQTIAKQQAEFCQAQQKIREQKEQNDKIVASIMHLSHASQRSSQSQERFQGRLHAAGSAFCEMVSKSKST